MSGTWYRAGLVSLTNGSDLINGVGTEFVANVLPGAIFFAPEGLYEVERAVSDTQLKLVEPYAGPTVAGAEFAIAPTQGAVVQATKQLQAFLSELGELKQAWESGELDPKGLATKGVKNTAEELPAVGNAPGDAWLVDGVLYMWTGSAWSNQGSTVTTPELQALRNEAVAAKDTSQGIAATFGDVAGAVGSAAAKAGEAGVSAASALLAKTATELVRDQAIAGTNARPSVPIALADAAIPVGGSFTAPLPDGSFQAYTKTSTTVATAFGAPSASLAAVLIREKLATSLRNIFNLLTDVITGYQYRSTGVQRASAAYMVTKMYPIAAGAWVSISGLGALKAGLDPYMHFWNGSTFLSAVKLPATAVVTDYLSEQAPAGTTHFSINLSTTVPPKLQIEMAAKPTTYEPHQLLENGLVKGQVDDYLYLTSAKNIFAGGVQSNFALNNTGIGTVAEADSSITTFIPVENGKTYTISGLDTSLITLTSNRRILGFSSDREYLTGFVKAFAPYAANTATVTIDNAGVKFLVVQLSRAGQGTLAQAKALRIQVEEGAVATEYEPNRFARGARDFVEPLKTAQLSDKAYTDSEVAKLARRRVQQFVEMGEVNPNFPIEVAPFAKKLAPFGVSYQIQGNATKDALGNTLFAEVVNAGKGQRALSANIFSSVGGVYSAKKTAVRAFEVPSGMLDNPDTLPGYQAISPLDNYAHPTIAYDATGVAGYKYWMVASILPGSSAAVTWEDEDIFVSNDAVTWLRIRSLYETDKTYTTASLRLPPHNLCSGARKNGFLPVPEAGDTIEISVPADNGAPALDRVNITLVPFPWKHDPAILIDGGYVYVYHSFHLSYAERDSGKNRFVVCTRTNDGINWECVRSDGSTLPLNTPEAARQMFTKDGSGRYNYLYYAYSRGNSNPEVLKYGAGDYEMVYGGNFNTRYKGTAPWNFDFATSYPFQDVGSGNHPGLLLSGSDLYLLNSTGFYKSINRGAAFTKYPHLPTWVGSVSNLPYKHALCIGAGGKVVIAEVKRLSNLAYIDGVSNQYVQTNSCNKIFLAEYASVAELVGYATTGLVDGYIDLQIDQVNRAAGTRKSMFFPYVGPTAGTPSVNNPHQRVKVCDLVLAEGDVLYVFVTLTARTGALVGFNGLAIS